MKRFWCILLLPSICMAQSSITDSLNAFSVDLLAVTSREADAPKNLALSPYTVWALLSVLHEGANGATAEQIENALKIPGLSKKDAFRNQFSNLTKILSDSDQGSELNVYNSIFKSQEFVLKKNFQNTAETNYGVTIQSINFNNQRAATDKINKYVEEATKHRIRNLVNPKDLDSAFIFMVSALYFKGAWNSPFNRTQTKTETFFDEKQNKLGEVQMMYQRSPFPYARFDWIQGHGVELPYGNGEKTSMIVMLPYKGQTIQGMLNDMTRYPFTTIMDHLTNSSMQFEDEDVQVYIPKFKVESDVTLNGVLHKLGIFDVFSGEKADLLGMFQHYLYVSRLIQRAEIEVNEEGTVASAASGASIVNKIPPPRFLANKPFLYFIVNKPTKSIIFGGRLTVPPNPPKQEKLA